MSHLCSLLLLGIIIHVEVMLTALHAWMVISEIRVLCFSKHTKGTQLFVWDKCWISFAFSSQDLLWMLSTAYCHHLQTLRRENRRFDKSRAPAKKKARYVGLGGKRVGWGITGLARMEESNGCCDSDEEMNPLHLSWTLDGVTEKQSVLPGINNSFGQRYTA